MERRWICKYWQAISPVLMYNAKFPDAECKHVLQSPVKEGLTSAHLPTFPCADHGMAGLYVVCHIHKGKNSYKRRCLHSGLQVCGAPFPFLLMLPYVAHLLFSQSLKTRTFWCCVFPPFIFPCLQKEFCKSKDCRNKPST